MMQAKTTLDFTPGQALRTSGLRLAIRIGISRATSPVKAAVVAQAQGIARYGFLAKAIRIKLKMYPSNVGVSVIGPSSKYTRTKGKFTRGPRRTGQKRKIIPAKYAHLVQKGTRRSREMPFLTRALDSAGPRYLADVQIEVAKEIERRLPPLPPL
ncbi:MAG: hypothetical protein ABI780_02675 [Ardenticatenales bacterium]